MKRYPRSTNHKAEVRRFHLLISTQVSVSFHCILDLDTPILGAGYVQAVVQAACRNVGEMTDLHLPLLRPMLLMPVVEEVPSAHFALVK